MQLIVEPLLQPGPAAQRVEIVERKGRGHPDTLCDRAAEALSAALCRAYVARTGRIEHHNVDKAVLVGGSAEVGFGGGRVTRPMRMIHVGRATDVGLDVAALAAGAARQLFAASLRHLDPSAHLEVEALIRPTSRALAGVFGAGGGVPLANDTSIGCGFAPLTATEQLVLAIERHLTEPATLAAHPYLGEDVKVLAVRVGETVELTVAAALVAAHVPSPAAYLEAKEMLVAVIERHAAALGGPAPRAMLNAADRPGEGLVYLTVTGSSAESGDDGQVGRGNRANGLITPSRPMSLEAVAGKNPISHVGKLYNTWANRLTAELAERPDVDAVTCQLASRIGAPITEPQVVWLGVSGSAARDTDGLRRHVREALDRLPALWRELLEPGWPVA